MVENITAALVIIPLIFGVSILILLIIRFFYKIFHEADESEIIAIVISAAVGIILLSISIAISLAKLALE